MSLSAGDRSAATKLLDGVTRLELPSHGDSRGVLTSIESAIEVPFAIERVFYTHHIRADRGGHAHRETAQVIIGLAGSFTMELSDGSNTLTYEMNDPTRGIFVPSMVFIRFFDFSPDAVCLVLASTRYDRSKSIRTWEDYLEALRS